MKHLKHILLSFLLLFSGVAFSQNKLISSGSNFIAVGDNLISIPFNQYSLNFDGVDENILCGNDASLDFERTDKFSISAWIKLAASGVTQGICSKITGATPDGYALRILNDVLRMRISNTQGSNLIEISGNTLLTDLNVWYNLIATYDGSSLALGIKLYVNGILEDQFIAIDNLTASISNNGDFAIGSFRTNLLFFNGNIDEVSVWKRELSQTDVSKIYNSGIPANLKYHSAAIDLVAWYRMGDGATFNTNWTLPDASINNNTGTSVNMEFLNRTHGKP